MKLSKLNLKGAPIRIISGGGVLAFLTLILMLGGFEKIVNIAITTQVRLVNNSNTWNQWKVIPIPVYLRVRVFNITNPAEFQLGAKPKLVEMGPYVYRESIYKINITADEETDTVRYQQVREYYFEPELSNGLEDDVVTMINIPYVGVAKMAHMFTDVDFLLAMLDDMLSSKGERLTRQEKIRDLLFDGFSVQSYLDLANDPMVQSAGEVHLPEKILDGKMGILEGKNGTADGWVVVRTGKTNSDDFGRIVKLNDKTTFGAYNGDSCNMINGTDGILFQPFLQTGMTLHLVVPELCRSIHLDYTETVYYDSIPAYRFRQPESLYASAQKNPENACFCPVNQSCPIDGLIPVASCFEGAPLMISQPHLLFVQNDIRELVEGLEPNLEKHWGFVDLHHITGVALEAKHRLQFNIEVSNWPAMPTFANVIDHILPVLWIEEGATLVGHNKDVLKLLTVVMTSWGIGQWVLLFLAIVILPALAFLLVFMRKKNDEVKLLMKSSSASSSVEKEAFS